MVSAEINEMTHPNAPTDEREQAQQTPQIRLSPAEADVVFALIDQGIRATGLRAITDTEGHLIPALDKLLRLTALPTPAKASTEGR